MFVMSTIFIEMSIVIASPAGKGLSVAYPAFSPRAHCRRRRIIGAGIEAARGGAWLLPPGDGQVIADTFFRIPPLRSMRKGISFRFHPIENSNLEPTSNMA